MILWLVQSTADHIDLAHGRVPPGLLGPQEALRLAGLRTPSVGTTGCWDAGRPNSWFDVMSSERRLWTSSWQPSRS
ncbi:MAG: hypothetical protein HZY76_16610 [Anaerolineae bacterium]|nr:MAG: hypothetical protein HZY76_16610 [Anaerolineae bacterium]